ncbi:hypothetical protein NW757_001196 [Fusarium falciforme]|nr:hypothetical protein NW757_001196 [Fusarium falciforme]
MVKFAAIVALVAPLVAARPQDRPMIVGGTAASAGDFPFIVSISYNGGPWCGGTLLNANTVMTAAHCTSGRSASAFQVRAGSLNRNSGGVTSSVSSIRIHPSFSSSTLNNDVSILKLSTPISTSSSISCRLVSRSKGVTSQGSSSSPVALRKVTIPIVSRTTCRSQYGTSAITTNMFCAGLAEGGKDSCQGDSGGPIVDTSNTVIGIVSWGEGCAQPNYSGVYARVGTLRSYIDGQL